MYIYRQQQLFLSGFSQRVAFTLTVLVMNNTLSKSINKGKSQNAGETLNGEAYETFSTT